MVGASRFIAQIIVLAVHHYSFYESESLFTKETTMPSFLPPPLNLLYPSKPTTPRIIPINIIANARPAMAPENNNGGAKSELTKTNECYIATMLVIQVHIATMLVIQIGRAHV